MDSFFENFSEEIAKTIETAKKAEEDITIESILSKTLFLKVRNGSSKLIKSEASQTIYMTLLGHNKQLAFGKTDRVNVPDIVTRLYQNLENILKANKGHKVSLIDNLEQPNIKTEGVNYYDISTWNIRYIKKTLKDLYKQIPSSILDEVNIILSAKGNYNLHQLSNYDNTSSLLYDDISLDIKCCIALKSNLKTNICISTIVPANELKTSDINLNIFLQNILLNAKQLIDYKALEIIDNKDINLNHIFKADNFSNLASYYFLGFNLNSQAINSYDTIKNTNSIKYNCDIINIYSMLDVKPDVKLEDIFSNKEILLCIGKETNSQSIYANLYIFKSKHNKLYRLNINSMLVNPIFKKEFICNKANILFHLKEDKQDNIPDAYEKYCLYTLENKPKFL